VFQPNEQTLVIAKLSGFTSANGIMYWHPSVGLSVGRIILHKVVDKFSWNVWQGVLSDRVDDVIFERTC